MLNYKIIFLKKTFVSFAILILIIIDKYLIIFVYLSIITEIKLYIILLRLLDDKSMIKFIKKFFKTI